VLGAIRDACHDDDDDNDHDDDDKTTLVANYSQCDEMTHVGVMSSRGGKQNVR